MNQSVFLFKGVQNAVKAELYRTIRKYTYIYSYRYIFHLRKKEVRE